MPAYASGFRLRVRRGTAVSRVLQMPSARSLPGALPRYLARATHGRVSWVATMSMEDRAGFNVG